MVELRGHGLQTNGNPLRRVDPMIGWKTFPPDVGAVPTQPAKGACDRPAHDLLTMFMSMIVQRVLETETVRQECVPGAGA